MPEVAAILPRRNLDRALKNVAHGIHTSEAAFARDRFHAVLTFFQAAPGRFHAQTFNELGRRRFHFSREHAREIPRTHGHALRQQRHGERFVQMIEHPCFQFEQRFSVRRLQRKRGAELRLAAWTPQIKH